MLVVSNTSPVSNLAIIGRLDLLRERYGRVVVPPTVKTELDALSHPVGKTSIELALRDGWLKVEPLPARRLGLKFTGLLGELVFAKHAAKLPSVKAEIARLRSEARFFDSAEIEAIILADAGEISGCG